MPPRARRIRLARLVVCLAAVGALGGCAVQPWVKPYERERLADPAMNPHREALAAYHRGHVHAVREAGRGATGVQGGGCGCN